MFNSLQSLVDLANSNPKSSTAVEPQEPPRPLVHEEKAASMVKTNSSDLVREANEKIRFSIHFDARKHQESQNHSSSSSKFSNVREDLFKVKQDINELKNDLKTAEQPLMVRLVCFWGQRTLSRLQMLQIVFAPLHSSTLKKTEPKGDNFWREHSNSISEIKESNQIFLEMFFQSILKKYFEFSYW